ncbi:hypothetical protein KA017_03440 [Candidatus Woesebacteria bacterium]|nr:hypothetical protein [Candidatus Woesebacteria bacterium]
MDQTNNLLAIVILGLFLELIIAYKIRSDKKRIEKIDAQYQEEFGRVKIQLEKIVSNTRKETKEILSATQQQYHEVNAELKNFTIKLSQRLDDITDEIVVEQKKLLIEHASKSSEELILKQKKDITH